MRHPRGSVAQLNRASDYGSEGCGFESRRNHKENQQWFSFFSVRSAWALPNAWKKWISDESRATEFVLSNTTGLQNLSVCWFTMLSSSVPIIADVPTTIASSKEDAHTNVAWLLISAMFGGRRESQLRVILDFTLAFLVSIQENNNKRVTLILKTRRIADK